MDYLKLVQTVRGLPHLKDEQIATMLEAIDNMDRHVGTPELITTKELCARVGCNRLSGNNAAVSLVNFLTKRCNMKPDDRLENGLCLWNPTPGLMLVAHKWYKEHGSTYTR